VATGKERGAVGARWPRRTHYDHVAVLLPPHAPIPTILKADDEEGYDNKAPTGLDRPVDVA
jgi:hypothetical protein